MIFVMMCWMGRNQASASIRSDQKNSSLFAKLKSFRYITCSILGIHSSPCTARIVVASSESSNMTCRVSLAVAGIWGQCVHQSKVHASVRFHCWRLFCWPHLEEERSYVSWDQESRTDRFYRILFASTWSSTRTWLKTRKTWCKGFRTRRERNISCKGGVSWFRFRSKLK
jgi:hypothetical protein